MIAIPADIETALADLGWRVVSLRETAPPLRWTATIEGRGISVGLKGRGISVGLNAGEARLVLEDALRYARAMTPGAAVAPEPMTLQPEIVLVAVQRWTSDGMQYASEEFEIRGGDITDEWARTMRAPEAPWCRVRVFRGAPPVARSAGGGTYLTGFGGSVWPGAWPELFERRGADGDRLTLLAETLFEVARQEAAQIGDSQ